MQVRDSGIGIPASALDHLFKSFSMVSSKEQQRMFGGTGLGLSISRQLCELMGGKMWVESTEGVGSVFHFTFRVPASFDGGGAYLQGISQEMAGKRMLLVQVNERAAAMISSMVGQWGVVTLTARSLSEVEELLRKPAATFDFALVDFDLGAPEEAEADPSTSGPTPRVKRSSSLTGTEEVEDQLMEGTPSTANAISPPVPQGSGVAANPSVSSASPPSISNGVDVAQFLRRSFPPTSSPPVLMLCALSQRQRSMRTVVDFFLSKPIKPSKLFAAILSALRPRPVIGLPTTPVPSYTPTPIHSPPPAPHIFAPSDLAHAGGGLPASPLTPNLSALSQSFSESTVHSPTPGSAPPRFPKPTIHPSASGGVPPSPPLSPSNTSPPGGLKGSAKRKREAEATAASTPLPPINPSGGVLSKSKSRLSSTPTSAEGGGDAASLLFTRCPLRILIAEDNFINQKVLCKMLNRLGYPNELIQIAGNGKVAVDFVVKAAEAAAASTAAVGDEKEGGGQRGGEEEGDEAALKRRLKEEAFSVVFMVTPPHHPPLHLMLHWPLRPHSFIH